MFLNKYILSIFLLFALEKNLKAETFNIKDKDKQLHIAASYGATLTGTLLFERAGFSRWTSLILASSLVMTYGLYKEQVIDKVASTPDILANTIGTGSAALMVITFKF